MSCLWREIHSLCPFDLFVFQRKFILRFIFYNLPMLQFCYRLFTISFFLKFFQICVFNSNVAVIAVFVTKKFEKIMLGREFIHSAVSESQICTRKCQPLILTICSELCRWRFFLCLREPGRGIRLIGCRFSRNCRIYRLIHLFIWSVGHP